MKITKSVLSVFTFILFFTSYTVASAATIMVQKEYCRCDQFHPVCTYQQCDDGHTGPISIAIVTIPNTVQAGQPVIISAEGGYENQPPAGVYVRGTLGFPQSGPSGNSNFQFNFNPTEFPLSVRPSSNLIFQNIGTISGTAPQTSGSYTLGFSSFFNPDLGTGFISYYSYVPVGIVVEASAQCSDGVNNDNSQGADQADPECHTDCNASNTGSYVATHDSETTPPNGSCPVAATLQLNGRAAFFQVVKTFFASITAKAFAAE